MMIEKNMELIKRNLKLRKPFIVIYDGDDDGIYYYDSAKNRYQGEFGYLDMEGMVEIVKHMELGDDYFIQLMVIDENNTNKRTIQNQID